MKDRTQRIELIKKIISEQVISSQDELQIRLQERGCDVTQATLSRDLRSLQVMKVNDAKNGYIYRLVEAKAVEQKLPIEVSRIDFMADGVVNIEFSGNLLVVKTLPGYANSVASIIDKANPVEIIGTVAGDDTILIIMREGVGRHDVVQALKTIMPRLENKF